MSTSKAKSDQPVVNNGGTVINGGNSSSPITNSVSLNEVSTQGDYGSQVKIRTPSDTEFTDTPGVMKAKDSGTFAYNPEVGTNYIVRGAGDNASKINNTNTDALNVGGTAAVTVHKLVSTSKLGSYETAQFDLLATPSSGVAPNRTKGTGAGDLSSYVSTSGDFVAQDTAASSTRSNPGKITYHIGVPVNDDYTSREVAESDPNVQETTTTTTTEAPEIILYFNAGVDGDWSNLNNWWTDSEHTVQATSLPTSANSVILSGSCDSNSGSEPTVVNFTMTGSYNNSINITVTGIATFNGNASHYDNTLTGNAVFNDNSENQYTIDGNATFNDESANYTTVYGNATFNGDSFNSGAVYGDATFNNSSYNTNIIESNATFNDNSRNLGAVTGTATFTGSACNSTGEGTAGTFVPNPPPACD